MKLLIAFLVACTLVHAATIPVSTCTAANINSVISASTTHDGDTVLLTCTGSVTWTATVTIPSTKGITLQVQNGTNTPKPSANFPLTITSAQNPVMLINIGPNHAVSRVSGFKFAPNTGTPDTFIEFLGQGTGTNGLGAFRLDNNYFDTNSANAHITIYSDSGTMYGLVDNNTFHDIWNRATPDGGPYGIQIWQLWHPSGSNQCWGCDGWTNNDFSYGAANFTFIEDNLFEQTAACGTGFNQTPPTCAHMRHYISSEMGARYVIRHNTFSNNFPDTNADLIDAHGLCIVSSNGAGSRGGEIYANTITGTNYDRAMQLRGGSFVVYDNIITSGAGITIEFDEYRAQGAGSCDSTSALTPIMPPWPVPTGAQWDPNVAWISHVTNTSNWQLPQQIFNTFVWNNRTPGGTLINPASGTTLESQYIQNNRDYFAAATKPSGVSSYTAYTYPHPLRGAAVLPTITTTTATNITTSGATSGGAVTSDGGAAITSEGVCYAISANPTTPCTSDGTTTPFTSSLSLLSPSTLYHYRAFATNSVGTGYGSDLTFTTLALSGIAKFQGRVKLIGNAGVGVTTQGAQLPQQWVHNYITPDTQANPICDFSGGFTEDDVTLSTISVAGLQAAINLWQGGNRRIKIPAGSLINGATYTNFQGTSPTGIAYAQNALIVMSPTTGNAPNVIANPTGCLLIESETPPTRYQTICANVPPDNTRPRNPNCTGDVANLWTIRQDHSSSNDTSYAAIYFPPGANHIIVRDGEFTILPGDAQSTTGAHGRSPILADAESHDLGLEYVWVHGWNPGDAAGSAPRTWTGQPTSNAALNSDGSCKNWNHTGTVSTNGTQVIWRSGDRFGGDFSDGVNLYGHTYVDAQAKIYIGGTAGVWHSGTQYTIASGGHDPTDMSVMTCSDGGGPGTGTMTCGDKVLTLSTSAGVQTDVVYNMSNPFAAMVPGCGDDLSNGVTWYANNSWIMWSQINKMHYWQTEGHSLLVGFQNGPLKIAHNWLEAGAGGLFFGGGAVDVSRQGPVRDVEIRDNYIGNDLWEKYLSAAQAHSPGPPWGCGPLDESETGAASHDTCTFQHSKKNPLELKFCVNCLLDGNDVEGSWTDGQNGLVGAWPNRNCSGGTLCGIFDSAGLPRVGIKHQTISNNLFHDGGQGIALGARCGGPGNGGGLCFPSSYEDVKNNVFYNIDAKEFGDQAGNFSNMLMNIGDTGQTYLCTMSRTNGVAHAHCANGSFTGPSSNVSIVRIVRTGTPGQKNGVVTIEYGNRKDLLIGGTVTLAVTGTGASNFNGTFTITGVENNINSTHSTTACDNNATPWVNATNQPCIGSTGRYSDTLVYTDTVNTQVASTDTLCASGTGTTCSTGVLGTDALSAMSLAYSATDITPGQDPVLIYTGNYDPDGNSNHGAGLGCSDNNVAGYATSGLSTLPLASLPGSAAGLDVYYAQSTLPDESSGIQCFLDNGAGQGNHLTIANNTIVSGDALAINNNALTSQERYTTIANNVYVAPDNSTGGGGCAGKRSFLTVPSSASTCEGTASLASFDQSTIKFYGNVIGLGRTPANWCTSPTGITCPALNGTLVNSFPAAFADIGFATTQAQQSGGCNKSLAPFNCPLMSLPWADNLKLSDLVISGTYAGKGADISAITAARASTKYTCATPCGSAGPFKDAP